MKNFTIVCTLGLLLAIIAQCAPAVDLQAGWYVSYSWVSLEGMQSVDNSWATPWSPTSSLGNTGYLRVDATAPAVSGGRMISVLADESMDGGTVFEDYGTYSAPYSYYQFVKVGWETNYDASRLQLQVYRHVDGLTDQLVWSQSQSGYQVGFSNIWNTSPLLAGQSVVFRVVAVPEPSGSVIMLILASGACFRRRRGN